MLILSNDLIGLFAALCTTSSFVPQALQTIRTQNTASISLSMYVIFATGTLCWAFYGYQIHSISVLLANAITEILVLIILSIKIKNDVLKI